MAWPVYKHLVPSGTEQARSRVEEEIQRAAVAHREVIQATMAAAQRGPVHGAAVAQRGVMQPAVAAALRGHLQHAAAAARGVMQPAVAAVAHREVCDVYSPRPKTRSRPGRGGMFASAVVACAVTAAVLASWLPLQVSIVTVFLFAGPHNWFEFRYFLMRLPARFGRSRNFFVTAFAGLAVLTVSYVSLPFIYQHASWSSDTWLIVLASWNTALLLWLAALIYLRSKQKRTSDWAWTVPVALALAALNWLGPEFFSLALVYVHPLVALWFLDRQLQRTRPQWVRTYRRCLCLLPLMLALMIWRLSQTTSLADDNGLFWRITQHSGAQLLPQLSSHMLVSVHLFLEMLHYAVWIVALPLIGSGFWQFKRAPKTSPRKALLIVGAVAVVILWVGFTRDYAQTRDLYFTIAIAHVLAEAPFLLKML